MKSKPKHMRKEVRKERRIYIIFLLLAFMLIVVLLTVLCVNISKPIELEPPKQPVFIGTKIVDRRYIPPDCYELLYFTGYDNGFGVEQWKRVNREEYERRSIGVRPEN